MLRFCIDVFVFTIYKKSIELANNIILLSVPVDIWKKITELL